VVLSPHEENDAHQEGWHAYDEQDAVQLRTEANVEVPSSVSQRRRTFPNRAAWLDAEMKKRGITALNQLKKVGGPDRDTVKKILAGNWVTDPVLIKLAAALSHYASNKYGIVTLDDIPKD